LAYEFALQLTPSTPFYAANVTDGFRVLIPMHALPHTFNNVCSNGDNDKKRAYTKPSSTFRNFAIDFTEPHRVNADRRLLNDM
jgi:hypothetical protein